MLVVAAALGAAALHRRHMENRLLQTWPEAAARDATLAEFAATLARPALVRHCAGCHGEDLNGDPKRGAPSLVDREWLHGDGQVGEIEQTINHGIRSGDHRGRDLADMPGFLLPEPYRRYHVASLSPAEVSDLTAFVLGLAGRAADASAATRGQALFYGALCHDCHTTSGEGDPAIGAPSLKRHAWLYGDSPQAIHDVIAYGRGGVCPSWAGRLSPVTIRAMAVYLHLRSGAT